MPKKAPKKVQLTGFEHGKVIRICDPNEQEPRLEVPVMISADSERAYLSVYAGNNVKVLLLEVSVEGDRIVATVEGANGATLFDCVLVIETHVTTKPKIRMKPQEDDVEPLPNNP